MAKSKTNSKSQAAPNEKRAQNKRRAAKQRDGAMGVVGLGASAGGIGVLQDFFKRMPNDSGLAFVVVMHLSPEHESNLAHVLQAVTAMPVTQVQDEVKTKANCVYVIPPNKHLEMRDSTLFLSEPQQAPGRRVAIDLFFRTLAQAYRQRAVCAVLSGTDSDGAIGLKYIKAQGGVTIAQDPDEAEYDSMPRRAIETGMVDWVLPVRQMPKKLVEFVKNERLMELPPAKLPNTKGDEHEYEQEHEREHNGEEPPGGELVAQETHAADDEAALQEVLVYLRSQTGHDFSHYKRATVLRRIARRLQVNALANIPDYLEFLRSHGGEPDELLHDLLIGVTHFFRDHDAFAALEANVPQLFAGKTPNDQVRAWTSGCATGEEAYSLAMVLCEQAEKLDAPPSIQIFATDIDDESITAARAGIYPLTIEADVSQERLRTYFAREQGHYRIKKHIREMVLFAPHDLLRDPPFSRLDLVSCRNLLIYLKRRPQERVLDIFHFALKPGGLLFIGGSESVDGANALFSAIDKHYRIYLRRPVPRPGWMIPALPERQRPVTETARPRPIPQPVTGFDVEHPIEIGSEERRAMLFGELHLKLLEQYGPPSVVIDENHEVIHLSENAGRYLQFGGGEPAADLLKLAPSALRLDLRAAIFRAGQEKRNVTIANVAVEVEGVVEQLDIHVRPLHDGAESAGYTLVVFEKKKSGGTPVKPGNEPAHEPIARHLETELQQTKEQLDRTAERYETANEELKASNEELQAMNEELRSTAEELETSKEELQSVNEELNTVNQELKNNVQALGRANSDLQNLIGSTEIATIFLDRALRIKRFTPRAEKLFNIIPADIGRPLAHITHQLRYEQLEEDVAAVLKNLSALEREVRDSSGHWFLTRLLPYLSGEDKIDGVVLNFVDISERKAVEESLRINEEQLSRAIAEAPIPIIMHAEDGHVLQISKSWTELTGYTSEEMPTFEAWLNRAYGFGANAVRAQMQSLFQGHSKVEQVEFEIVTRSGERRQWSFSASAPGVLRDGRRFIIAMALDVTDRHRLSSEVAGYLRKFDTMVATVPDFIYSFDLKGRFTFVNQALLDLWGKSFEEAVGKDFHELDYPPELAKKLQRQIQEVIDTGKPLKDRTPYTSAAGERQYEYIFVPLRADDGEVEAVAGVTRDITEIHEAAAELLTAKDSLAVEVSALAQLHEFSTRMLSTSSVGLLLEQVLDAVMEVQGADFGSIQLLHPSTGALEIIASRGFEQRLLDHFAGRPDRSTTCGRALEQNERVIIEDVKKDPAYRKHRRAAAEAGYRAVQTTPLRDRSGATLGLLTTHFRDPHRPSERDLRLTDLYAKQAAEIVSLKQAQSTLRESRERFQLLVDGARDYAMFLIEPDNRISYWSAGAERIFGWSAEEAIGQNAELVFTPEDRARGQEEKERGTALRNGAVNDRRWHMRKDGSRIWIDGVMRRLDDEDGNPRGFAKVARDATAQRLAEEELKKSHREMERRVKERTAELTGANQRLQRGIEERARLEQEILLVSEREKRRIGQDLHDSLCQELAAAAFFLQSSAQKTAQENPAHAEVLTEAARIVNANVGLARDLARGLHLIELSAAGLTSAFRELAFRTSTDEITCRFDYPKSVRVRDEAVALNLYRIAQEAVANALKHGKASEIVIALAREKKAIVLVVKDNGAGLAKKGNPKGMGVHIMKYRADTIGADFSLEARRRGGAIVRCVVPPR